MDSYVGTNNHYNVCHNLGSMMLLQQYPKLTKDVSGMGEVTEIDGACRKDTGEHNKVRKWSRGYQFIIGGGGHIEAFTPLYQ